MNALAFGSGRILHELEEQLARLRGARRVLTVGRHVSSRLSQQSTEPSPERPPLHTLPGRHRTSAHDLDVVHGSSEAICVAPHAVPLSSIRLRSSRKCM